MRPDVPSSHTPAVWKHSSIRRGAISVGWPGRLVSGREVRGESSDHVAVHSPGPLEHLVGGAVEVDPVDGLAVHLALCAPSAPGALALGGAGGGPCVRRARPVKCTVSSSPLPGSVRRPISRQSATIVPSPPSRSSARSSSVRGSSR